MKASRLTLTLSALALAAASFTANADILFQNLGTAAPPATIGSHTMTPFDAAPQNAIPDGTSGITIIPGNPGSGELSINHSASKFTAPSAAAPQKDEARPRNNGRLVREAA